MHYQLTSDIKIKSEYAALSTKQTNKQIMKFINGQSNGLVALDYGCGKLRNSLYLYNKCSLLVTVDSSIQLNRIQTINGQKTSVNLYIRNNMSNARAYEIDNQEWLEMQYDLVLCNNVLSSIPSYEERVKVLENIHQVLKPNGRAFLSVQFRNSYFKTYNNSNIAYPALDGWIIKKGNVYTYYGIIMPGMLVDLCKQHGLKVICKKLIDGSVYLEVGVV